MLTPTHPLGLNPARWSGLGPIGWSDERGKYFTPFYLGKPSPNLMAPPNRAKTTFPPDIFLRLIFFLSWEKKALLAIPVSKYSRDQQNRGLANSHSQYREVNKTFATPPYAHPWSFLN